MGSTVQTTGGNENDELNRCLRSIIISLTIRETKTYVSPLVCENRLEIFKCPLFIFKICILKH